MVNGGASVNVKFMTAEINACVRTASVPTYSVSNEMDLLPRRDNGCGYLFLT